MASPELQQAALDELIASLNPAQREAVTHLRGPLLIFAGAGSGKTRVLTTRIANLIAQREVWPDRLLLDPKKYPPPMIGSAISRAKNELVGPEAYPDREYGDEVVRRVYERYDEVVRRSGGLDFDDLIGKVVLLLQSDEESRERWRDRFRHVLVDEYQDTNRAQYTLVNELAGGHRNLAVVGDDDQCLVAGTRVTMGDGSTRAIEDIRPGDLVLSGYGSGRFGPARVVRTHRAEGRRAGIALTTLAGRRLVSTPEHTHFAGTAGHPFARQRASGPVLALCAGPSGG